MSTLPKKAAASPSDATSVSDMGSLADSGSKRRRFFGLGSGSRRKNKVEAISPKNKTVISPAASGKTAGTQVSSASSQKSSSSASSNQKVPTKVVFPPPTAKVEDITAALAFEKELPPSPVNNPTEDASKTNEMKTSLVEAEAKQDLPKERSIVAKEVFVKPPTSWLARTKAFKKLCATAFDLVDDDKSGTVDEKELYSGLLLIHLKLGMYAGPAACRPLGRERVAKVFRHYDDDNSGLLDKNEFEGVMVVLFSNVLFRVLVQWSMTIIIVPLVASRLLELFYHVCEFMYLMVVNADEYLPVANYIELKMEAAMGYVWERTPDIVVFILLAMAEAWESVPDSVWNAAPLALISTILGILIVPWIIIKVDDFFLWLAEQADSDRSGYDDVTAPTTPKVEDETKADSEKVDETPAAVIEPPVEASQIKPTLSGTKNYL